MRFKAGDLARVVVAGPKNIGAIVEIALVGPFPVGKVIYLDGSHWRFKECADYVCTDHESVMDYQLAPINPPAEPASLTREKNCEADA